MAKPREQHESAVRILYTANLLTEKVNSHTSATQKSDYVTDMFLCGTVVTYIHMCTVCFKVI